MLGIHPFQKELENHHMSSFKNQDSCASKCLLSNLCLDFFGRQTGIGIRERKEVYRTSTLRLQLCKYKSSTAYTHSKLSGASNFIYTPCYFLLSGFDSTERIFSEEIFLQNSKELVAAAVADFWISMKSFPYLAGEILENCVNQRLDNFLTSGIRKDTPFRPSSPMSFYLHGSAGTGKSTFVTAFSCALQSCLRGHFDADREVKVVKVPLNATNQQQLKSIMTVQVLSCPLRRL